MYIYVYIYSQLEMSVGQQIILKACGLMPPAPQNVQKACKVHSQNRKKA